VSRELSLYGRRMAGPQLKNAMVFSQAAAAGRADRFIAE
jgi:hypothetical protein